MQQYPLEICQKVCDPARGLPSTNKFAPNLAELRTALEAEAGPWRRQMERERLARKSLDALPPPVEDRSKRKTYAELQADCAKAGIFIGGKPAPIQDVTAFRESHGLSQEQWDAIPNALR
jgi:hypothetical protein